MSNAFDFLSQRALGAFYDSVSYSDESYSNLADEITSEIDAEILRDIRRLANDIDTMDEQPAKMSEQDGYLYRIGADDEL